MRKSSDLVSYFIIGLAVVLTVFPIYYLIVTSIEPFLDAFSTTPALIPRTITLAAYTEAFGRWNFLSFLTNSLVISASSVALGMLLGIPMAYGLARFKLPRNMGDSLAFFILSIRMIPPIVGVIPLFIMFSRLGLLDSYLGMTLAYTGGLNLPFTVWVMRGFFLDFPKELEESAIVDGASAVTVLGRVVVPLSLTAITTTAALIFTQTWNEFLMAVFLTGRFKQTVPVLISSFFGSNYSYWTDLMACGTLAIIPVFLILVVVQRQIVRGLTLGAIKG